MLLRKQVHPKLDKIIKSQEEKLHAKQDDPINDVL